MIGESHTHRDEILAPSDAGRSAIVFAFISVEAVNTEWSRLDDLHTMLEASAAIIAFVVGAMALTRN